IFDKTGTLTYGEPELVGRHCAEGVDYRDVLALAASLERYSKHPLAEAIVEAGKRENVPVYEVSEISEPPGKGLTGRANGRTVTITSRKHLLAANPQSESVLPPAVEGMECLVLIDGEYAASMQFRDTPRREGASFVHHLLPKH